MRSFFMCVPVGPDGAMDMGPSISKRGDYVDLRAKRSVLAVVSNCPQMKNPMNDHNPTLARGIVYAPWAPPGQAAGLDARMKSLINLPST